MKRIDLPPLWLLGFAVLAWFQARFWSMGLNFGDGFVDLLAGLLIGGGIILTALAVVEFRKHRTTINPHDTPSSLIRSGIFKRSRNPIYLADVMILTGLILLFDAVLALPLIPIFVWILEKRFIVPEENRMRREFRADFARYEEQTRRWV
jgi:protein-S-isoprenylcysteine O-methyltransferase Ste14